MRRLILGTAGHIDHGKTALVKALTGVDTDRLAEEKRRGITIDLGFAELDLGEAGRLGVVDVPGHESFIRNMLAGATGIDVVLLVVAADEGVMPQTREHLAIVELLGVEQAVVAITKADLVDGEWLALVQEEVQQFLRRTRYGGAATVITSTATGAGLPELRAALARVAETARQRTSDDLARLPIDRVFTVHGTGTVVTGTLWSGALRLDDRVWLLPDARPARVRGLQVHGRRVEEATAGERTAVALSGSGVDTGTIRRGHVLVTSQAWTATRMLTVRLALLADTTRHLKRRQRVRVHLGTAEVMATVALLDRDLLPPREAAWAQLHLERPIVARARDRLVVRSYSPMTTIGGARVAETEPPRRKRLDEETRRALEALLEDPPAGVLPAALSLAGWIGVADDALPVRTGLPPAAVAAALAEMPASIVRAGGRTFAPRLGEAGIERLRRAIHAFHELEALRPGIPLEEVRRQLPRNAPPVLAEALLARLVESDEVEIRGTVAARRGFEPRLTAEQEQAKAQLYALYRHAALAPPAVAELPGDLQARGDLWPLLKLLEEEGKIVPLADQLFASSEAVREAAARLQREFAGRSGLGPADFKSLFPVSRKHLIPLLEYFDRTGWTIRAGGERRVPEAAAAHTGTTFRA